MDDLPDWRSIIDDPNTTTSQLRPILESYDAKIGQLTERIKTVGDDAEQQTRQAVTSLHNKMFKKLLDAEEDADNQLEEAKKKIRELESQLRAYEIAGDKPVSHSMAQDYLEKEESFQRQIETLNRKVKDLSDELTIEKMKTESMETTRRQSISTLHNRLFKKLLDAEDDYETDLSSMKERSKQLEQQLKLEQMKNSQMETTRRQSITSLSNNMFQKLLDAEAEHDTVVGELKNQIKILQQQIKIEDLADAVAESPTSPKDDNHSSGDDFDDDPSSLAVIRPVALGDIKSGSPLFPPSPVEVGPLPDDVDSLKARVAQLSAQLKSVKQELQSTTDDLQAKNASMESQLRSATDKIRQADTQVKAAESTRRDSIHSLHQNMFQKLLDAETQYEEEKNRLEHELAQAQEDTRFYREKYEQKCANDGTQPVQLMDAESVSPLATITAAASSGSDGDDAHDLKQRLAIAEAELEAANWRNEETETTRRQSITFLSSQMMNKLLEAEEQHDREMADARAEVKQLKRQLGEAKTTVGGLQQINQERRNSLTSVSTDMFYKVLEAQREKSEAEEAWEQEMAQLKDELLTERAKNAEAESVRRGSVSQLSQNMFKKLLEAEDEHESDVKQMQRRIDELEQRLAMAQAESAAIDRDRAQSLSQMKDSMWKNLLAAEEEQTVASSAIETEVHKLRKQVAELRAINDHLQTSKVSLATELSSQLNTLRSAIRAYNRGYK